MELRLDVCNRDTIIGHQSEIHYGQSVSRDLHLPQMTAATQASDGGLYPEYTFNGVRKNAASYEQVTVDGVTGTLIQRPVDDAPQYALIWIKDGIVYAISGLGANSQQAIDLANSLP